MQFGSTDVDVPERHERALAPVQSPGSDSRKSSDRCGMHYLAFLARGALEPAVRKSQPSGILDTLEDVRDRAATLRVDG